MTNLKPYTINAVASIAMGICAAQAAYAENKLFPTDVLNNGQFDATVDVNTEKTTQNYVFTPAEATAKYRNYTSQLSAAVRYGVNANFTIGVNTNVDRIKTIYTYNDYPARYDYDAAGVHSNAIFARYAFVGNEKNAPFSLTGQLRALSYTDHNPNGEGYNSLVTQIIAGWDCGQGIRSYADLHITTPDKASHEKSIALVAGSWIPVSAAVTLDPYIELIHWSATSNIASVNGYSVGLAAYVDVGSNTYVVPSASYSKGTDYNTLNGLFDFRGAKTESAEVQLYHLF